MELKGIKRTKGKLKTCAAVLACSLLLQSTTSAEMVPTAELNTPMIKTEIKDNTLYISKATYSNGISIGWEGFKESVDKLSEEFDESNANAQKKYSFDSIEDKNEGIIHVDMDFVGNEIMRPVDIIFVMDQSGSMNMHYNKEKYTGGYQYTIPSLNPSNVHRLRITADGISYYYLINPSQFENITDWTSVSDRNPNPIKTAFADACEKELGFTPVNITIEKETNYSELLYSPKEGTEKTVFPMESTSIESLIDSSSIILSDATVSNATPSDATVSNATKSNAVSYSIVDSDKIHLLDYYDKIETIDYTGENQYHSPETVKVGSEISDLQELIKEGRPFDRMMASKYIMGDLANMIFEGSDRNRMGFVNFAGDVKQKTTNVAYAWDEADWNNFYLTDGYGGTNHIGAYEEAIEMLKNRGVIDNDERDTYVILLTDGAPNGNAFATVEADELKNDYNVKSIVVGAYMRDGSMTSIEEYASLLDGKTPAMYYCENTDDMIELYEILKEILRTVSYGYEEIINANMKLKIDENYPIHLEWVTEGSAEGETETAKITSLEKGKAYGITLTENEDGSSTLKWDSKTYGFESGRLSFYKYFDIQTANLDDQGALNSELSNGTNIGYILKDKDSGNSIPIKSEESIHVETTKINLSLTTTTDYLVKAGDPINYHLHVTNSDNFAVEDLLTYCSLPVDTTFAYSPHGIYNESTNRVEFMIPSIEPNETLTLDFTVFVADDKDSGIITNIGYLGLEDAPVIGTLYSEVVNHEVIPTEPEEDGDENSGSSGGTSGGSAGGGSSNDSNDSHPPVWTETTAPTSESTTAEQEEPQIEPAIGPSTDVSITSVNIPEYEAVTEQELREYQILQQIYDEGRPLGKKDGQYYTLDDDGVPTTIVLSLLPKTGYENHSWKYSLGLIGSVIGIVWITLNKRKKNLN